MFAPRSAVFIGGKGGKVGHVAATPVDHEYDVFLAAKRSAAAAEQQSELAKASGGELAKASGGDIVESGGMGIFIMVKVFIYSVLAILIIVFIVAVFLRYRHYFTSREKGASNSFTVNGTLGEVVCVPLTRMSAPLPTGVDSRRAIGVFGRYSNEQPLLQFRPYKTDKPEDYYGIIKVSNSESGTLVISNASDYFEVVVYSYPDWKIVYAEIDITEVPLDFLDAGSYVVIVYSVNNIGGTMFIGKNSGRPKPPQRAHRTFRQDQSAFKEESIERVVKSKACSGSIELACITSTQAHIWPGTVYTRVETLFMSIPAEATEIFVVIPSYGIIIEGAEDHIGRVIHEGDNATIYQAVSKPPLTGNGDNIVSLTVVYPNISPTSQIAMSPILRGFIYGLV